MEGEAFQYGAGENTYRYHNLASFGDEETICACERWTETSKAMVAQEPEEGGVPVPPEAASCWHDLFSRDLHCDGGR